MVWQNEEIWQKVLPCYFIISINLIHMSNLQFYASLYSTFGYMGCVVWIYINIQIIKHLFQLKAFCTCLIIMVSGLTLNLKSFCSWPYKKSLMYAVILCIKTLPFPLSTARLNKCFPKSLQVKRKMKVCCINFKGWGMEKTKILGKDNWQSGLRGLETNPLKGREPTTNKRWLPFWLWGINQPMIFYKKKRKQNRKTGASRWKLLVLSHVSWMGDVCSETHWFSSQRVSSISPGKQS